MKEIDKRKAIIQKEAIEAIQQPGNWIVTIATGGGKSKIAIDYAIEEEKRQRKLLKVLLVVPTEKLRDENWHYEFMDWSNQEHYDRIERYCYKSVNKIKEQTFDIVILDELQNVTPLNAEFFSNNHVKKIIGLSATPPKEAEKRMILNRLGLKIAYELKLDEAVKRGIVSPFRLTFVEFELNNTHKYIKAGNKKTSWMTTEKKQYEYLSEKIKLAQNGNVRHESLKFMRLNRMRFIYNLKSKEQIAKYMLSKVIPLDERTLIFAGSIKMAEKLEPNTFHSKSDDIAFQKFMKSEISRLSAVQALNEGMNIPNLDNALIVQVNSKERHLIQKIGRIVRYREGHMANIYIIYAKGTVDEKWVKVATENIDTSNVNTIKFKV